MTMISPQLLKQYPLISDQVHPAGIATILRELETVLTRNVPGDVVELGCYIGTTSLFIRRVLDHYGQSGERTFHAYDSFEGLPPKTAADHNAAGMDFVAGELLVSKKQFLHEFQRAKLAPPVTHKGWFSNLTAADMPEHIAFAFLDGDFYESIIDSLRLVWPRLDPHGTIVIDDYKRETLPGVERAIRDFFQGKSYQLRGEQNLAIIYP